MNNNRKLSSLKFASMFALIMASGAVGAWQNPGASHNLNQQFMNIQQSGFPVQWDPNHANAGQLSQQSGSGFNTSLQGIDLSQFRTGANTADITQLQSQVGRWNLSNQLFNGVQVSPNNLTNIQQGSQQAGHMNFNHQVIDSLQMSPAGGNNVFNGIQQSVQVSP